MLRPIPNQPLYLDAMPLLTPDLLLPLAMIAIMVCTAFSVGVKIFLADPQRYESTRHLSGSPKRAVLGLAAPEVPHEMDSDVERGFALGYRDQVPFVVLNGKLPIDRLT